MMYSNTYKSTIDTTIELHTFYRNMFWFVLIFKNNDQIYKYKL